MRETFIKSKYFWEQKKKCYLTCILPAKQTTSETPSHAQNFKAIFFVLVNFQVQVQDKLNFIYGSF